MPRRIECDLDKNDSMKLICAGDRHSVFISSHGVIFCCGQNKFGECGLSSKKPSRVVVPTPILSFKDPLRDDERIIDVVASDHTVILTNLGAAYSWGKNDEGQCSYAHEFYYQHVTCPSRIRFLSEPVDRVHVTFIHPLFLFAQDKQLLF
eukprot:CAMPEP_0117433376 /NCGR_PEP_ID=MMETSP0758-20121206/12757_1 /TAXON_ID=63605 /ORGANISM="Percolomonas cosmopolitus, Strain AE-1 (ATCC 50343)" /LENGTH=149 /DNA_ID=CAMNT_0005224017 /DNA_START=153 /DNA_END=599 /DNA_ORIENTATION=+